MKKIINSVDREYQPVETQNLVLDAVPTVNSFNGVTSDAVARAIAGASGEVPQVLEGDNGKILTAVYDEGGPAVEWAEGGTGLPEFTAADEGKVLGVVVSGEEQTADIEWIEPQGAAVVEVQYSTAAAMFNTVKDAYLAGQDVIIKKPTSLHRYVSIFQLIGVRRAVDPETGYRTGDPDQFLFGAVDESGENATRHMCNCVVTLTASELSYVETPILPSYPYNNASYAGKVLRINDSSSSPAPEWATVNEVPAIESTNDGMVLKAVYNSGDPYAEWQPAGGGETPLPALPNSYCLRFEFTESDFDPSQGMSTFDWHQVQVSGRNIWDLYLTDYNLSQKFFYTFGYTHPCAIIDGMLDMSAVEDTDWVSRSMSGMFYGCDGLTSAKFSMKFTGNYTIDFRQMFIEDARLETVDIYIDSANAVTGSVAEMFNRCFALKSVKFNRLRADVYHNGLSNTFSGCQYLDTIEGLYVTGTLADPYDSLVITNAFNSCRKLTSVDSIFSAGGPVYVKSPSNAFYNCNSLKSIPVFVIRDSNADAQYMFQDCSQLRSAHVVMDTVATASGMFAGCSSLTDVDIGTPSALVSADSMFSACTSLMKCPKISGSAVLDNVDSTFSGMRNVSDDSAATEYTALSGIASITSHSGTFSNTGANTVAGTAALANIPSSWGGTGA